LSKSNAGTPAIFRIKMSAESISMITGIVIRDSLRMGGNSFAGL
jgi:hypothetical protein